MFFFVRFIGLDRRLISCLGLLLIAGTGCTDAMRRNPQPKVISNEDVVQIQPVVHSHSFAMRNIDATRQLAAGIYNVENGVWRWTAGNFGIVLATPHRASTRGANLMFAFYIPDAIMRRTGPITLTAYLNEAEVGATTYTTAGAQRFSAVIPADLMRQSPVAIDFHLDRYVPKVVLDPRELGVVADSVSLESE